jgi:hypothetical protein
VPDQLGRRIRFAEVEQHRRGRMVGDKLIELG